MHKYTYKKKEREEEKRYYLINEYKTINSWILLPLDLT